MLTETCSTVSRDMNVLCWTVYCGCNTEQHDGIYQNKTGRINVFTILQWLVMIQRLHHFKSKSFQRFSSCNCRHWRDFPSIPIVETMHTSNLSWFVNPHGGSRSEKKVFHVTLIKEKHLLTSPFFVTAHKIDTNPAGGRGNIYYERGLHDIG
jgi:hypothetical protein